MAVPSRLNEYPVGTTTPTVERETPRCSILAISRGSADSEDDVDTIRRNSRARYLNSLKMLIPVTSLSSVPRITTTNAKQAR